MTTNLDYKYYINKYTDLKGLSPFQCQKHWDKYGKIEGRFNCQQMENLFNQYLKDFDWKFYVSSYYDLQGFNENQARSHFIQHGIHEGRIGKKITPTDSYTNIPIIIYYSLCVINDGWIDIFKDQMNTLNESKLCDIVDKILIVQTPPKDINFNFLPNNIISKITIIKVVPNDRSEGYTLHEIWNQSKNTHFYCLYMHSKGITHINTPLYNNILDWRKLMEYFLIEKYEECISKLNDYHAVGCNLSYMPTIHFSGNFWWSKSSYIMNLPDPLDEDWLPWYNFYFVTDDVNFSVGHKYKPLNKQAYSESLEHKKYNNEAWIGRIKNPNFYCIFSSNILHYSQVYPDNNYRNCNHKRVLLFYTNPDTISKIFISDSKYQYYVIVNIPKKYKNSKTLNNIWHKYQCVKFIYIYNKLELLKYYYNISKNYDISKIF